jgi:hypothetical protein
MVTSFNDPGRNATGVHIFTAALEAKRLGLLHELIPHAASIGILLNPKFPYAKDQLGQIQTAADGIGQTLKSSAPPIPPKSTVHSKQCHGPTLLRYRWRPTHSSIVTAINS